MEHEIEHKIEQDKRYKLRFMYGRYEVVDQLTDRPICYGSSSEEMELILTAMNTYYEMDTMKWIL